MLLLLLAQQRVGVDQRRREERQRRGVRGDDKRHIFRRSLFAEALQRQVTNGERQQR